ncbi:hypothetical protein JCM17823_05910 [Halorubrum gandharaense]
MFRFRAAGAVAPLAADDPSAFLDHVPELIGVLVDGPRLDDAMADPNEGDVRDRQRHASTMRSRGTEAGADRTRSADVRVVVGNALVAIARRYPERLIDRVENLLIALDDPDPAVRAAVVATLAALPALSFIVTGYGLLALTMRGNSIQVLGEDYVRVAQLRGLPDRRIALRYVGRNAVLPLYTSLLISIGFMFGGSIILEILFQYRGIGFEMNEGIIYRDMPLMMGTFLVITFGVVIALWVGDATYGKLDPRIKSGDEGEAY